MIDEKRGEMMFMPESVVGQKEITFNTSCIVARRSVRV